MSSYAEQVVDRGVDRAWMQLRLRLADLLAGATVDEPVAISFTPQAADEDAPAVIIEADGTDLVVRIDLDGDLDWRFRFDSDERARLAALGMRIENGGPVLLVGADEVDRAAHYAYAVLHEMWDVVHPSFLAIDPDDLSLVDEPPTPDAKPREVPAMAHPSSLEELNDWVDIALTPEFGHAPHRDDDGDICVSGKADARAIVSVRSESRIEVWTVLAEDVEVRKAHELIDEWSQQYSYHRFFLVEDRLVASIVLFAAPFVPGHLVAALQGTLFVSGRLRRRAKRLERSKQRRRPSARLEPDPRLMSLFVSARRVSTAELVESAGTMSMGSEPVLQRWKAQSTAAHRDAKRALQAQGEVHDMYRRSLSAWRRVIRALDLALADVAPKSQGSK